jgi:hypothetical protein
MPTHVNAATLNDFIESLDHQIDNTSFQQTMEVISEFYTYTPTRFINGLGDQAVINEAGSNEGSCKLFAFAKLHDLNEAKTLALFGDFYRKDVLANPDGEDHANIRTFMKEGWPGIRFDSMPLAAK